MAHPISGQADTAQVQDYMDRLREKILKYMFEHPNADRAKVIAAFTTKNKSMLAPLSEHLPGTSARSVKKLRKQTAETADALADSKMQPGQISDANTAKQLGEARALELIEQTFDDRQKQRLAQLGQSGQSILESLAALHEGITTKILQARQMIAEQDALKKFDFINTLSSTKGLLISWDRQGLKNVIGDLESRDEKRAELVRDFGSALDHERAGDAGGKLNECKKALSELQTLVGKASQRLEESARRCTVAIDDSAVEALAFKLAKEDLEKLETTKSFAQRALTGVGLVFERTATTGTITRAIDLFITSANKAAKDQIVAHEKDAYLGKHTKVQAFNEHNANPLLIANKLVDDQKDALSLFIKSLGVTLSAAMIPAEPYGSIVMQVWSPVSTAVRLAIETYLGVRIKRAEELLKGLPEASGVDKVKAAFREAYGKVKEELTENIANTVNEKIGATLGGLREGLQELAAGASEAATGEGEGGGEGGSWTDKVKEGAAGIEHIKEHPGDFATMILEWIVPPIMEAVLKFVPPEPAQIITGDALVGMISDVAIAQIPPGFLIANMADKTKATATKPLDFSNTGLDLAEWSKFLDTNAERSEPAKKRYYVAMHPATVDPNARVWGYYDGVTKTFEPDRMHDSMFEDWTVFEIWGDGYSKPGYRERTKSLTAEFPGTWFKVKVGNLNYVMCKRDDGCRWGRVMDHAQGPRGTDYLLGAQIEKFAKTVELTG